MMIFCVMSAGQTRSDMKHVNVIVFNDFTLLDAFGPVDVLGRLKEHYIIDFFSFQGGMICAAQGLRLQSKSFEEIVSHDVLLIPGGFGTRALVTDNEFIGAIAKLVCKAEIVLCVCTASALVAKTGLLDDRKATSNKMALDWVRTQGYSVLWQPKSRWVVDGKFYTSSGVSAGIDMALGFVEDTLSVQVAEKIAASMEYVRNNDPQYDPFARI